MTAGQHPDPPSLGIPPDEEGPVFREPWEAHAFALALMLHERGVFTRPEWASTLATEIKHAERDGDPDTGETYYLHWLTSLERMVAERGLTEQATLAKYRDAWAQAAARTPHGTPIELSPQDLANCHLSSLGAAPGGPIDTTIRR